MSTDRDWLVEIVAKHHGIPKLTPHMTRAIEQAHGKLIDAIVEAGWESDESIALRDRMASLLTRTARELKGEPRSLSSHDWSDLPDVARALVAERDALRRELASRDEGSETT
jgi:hypothetical protein